MIKDENYWKEHKKYTKKLFRSQINKYEFLTLSPPHLYKNLEEFYIDVINECFKVATIFMNTYTKQVEIN